MPRVLRVLAACAGAAVPVAFAQPAGAPAQVQAPAGPQGQAGADPPGQAAAGAQARRVPVPLVTVSPVYPVAAIRQAKQGRAVACFLVDSEGRVNEPRLVELSDEVFRAPTLEALARSRYVGWDDPGLRLEACRTFVFRLEPRHPQAPPN